jgi:hypothetical protein
MRRAFLGLAVTALAVLAFAGPAGAASAQVTTFRFSGTFAGALWDTRTATSDTGTLVDVSKSKGGSELFVDQFTVTFDSSGNVTGAAGTTADVTSGFSFTLQQPLASASVSGLGLPGQTCTFDANFNEIGCTATTIDVTSAWTGQGPISRSVENFHFKSDGFSETDHFAGTERDATATGTFNGGTLTAGDLLNADLATDSSGTVRVCIGTSC